MFHLIIQSYYQETFQTAVLYPNQQHYRFSNMEVSKTVEFSQMQNLGLLSWKLLYRYGPDHIFSFQRHVFQLRYQRSSALSKKLEKDQLWNNSLPDDWTQLQYIEICIDCHSERQLLIGQNEKEHRISKMLYLNDFGEEKYDLSILEYLVVFFLLTICLSLVLQNKNSIFVGCSRSHRWCWFLLFWC